MDKHLVALTNQIGRVRRHPLQHETHGNSDRWPDCVRLELAGIQKTFAGPLGAAAGTVFSGFGTS
jgi:hypothetical protein